MRSVSRGGVAQLDKSRGRARCRRWMLSVTVNGRRRQRRFSGTYTEAVAGLEAWRTELAGDVDGSSETFAGYARRWAAWRADSGSYSEATLRRDGYMVSCAERCPAGGMRLSELTPDDMRASLSWLRHHPARGGELSATTVSHIHVGFKSMLRQAVDDGLLASSPMQSIRRPKLDTKEREALTPDEVAATLDLLDSQPPDGRRCAIYLMLALGLRRGEACGLLASDIDGTIAHVRRQFTRRGLEPPKSAAGVRDLPMPRRLREYLTRWMRVRIAGGYGDAPTLVCDPAGRPILPDVLAAWWKRERDALGCGGMVLHQLRHSNLSMMARHMPSAYDLKAWAGWSSLEPAMVYVHDDHDALRRAVSGAFGYTSVTPAAMG